MEKIRISRIVLLIAVASLFLAILHWSIAPYSGFITLFGAKDNAVFDWWSIFHLMAGVLIGSWLLYYRYVPDKNWKKMLLVIFVISFVWEVFELFAELGSVILFSKEYWKYGYEHWMNRVISDQVITVGGGLIGYNYKRIWAWMLPPVVVWMIVSFFV
ncbi:hypothetical protein ACFL2R_01075 [Patescibacteria group bacterium]